MVQGLPAPTWLVPAASSYQITLVPVAVRSAVPGAARNTSAAVGWAGTESTVTSTGSDVKGPQKPSTVTEYVPAVLTVMLWLVGPLLHDQPDASEAVRVTSSPSQKVGSPLRETVGVSSGSSCTKMLAMSVQPAPSSMVTVMVPP